MRYGKQNKGNNRRDWWWLQQVMNRRLACRVSEREMTTPLFLLRCTEVGISIRDLDLLTIGLVLDMWTEKANDGVKYRRIADQSDFDKF